MVRRDPACAFWGLLVLSTAGCAEVEVARLSGQIDSTVNAIVDESLVAGAAVVVLRGDETVHAKGYGFANVEDGIPVGVESLFNIASVTKLFTGAALVSLAEAGALDLDDSLLDWIPEFPNPEQGSRISLRQLVNHTSGLNDYVAADLDRWEATGAPLTAEFVLEHLRDRPLDFEPGAHWAYTNSGFYLAGIVIERSSGMPWQDYVAKAILSPVGLHGIRLCDDVAETVAVGYELGDSGFARAPLYLETGIRGDGGLCASALDLARFPRLLESGSLLSAQGLAMMRAPTRLSTGAQVDYGLGARLGSLQGRSVWGHTGGHAGTVAVVARYPADDVTIVVLTNTIRSDQDALVLLGEVAAGVFGLDAEQPVGQPADADLLGRYTGTYRGGRGGAHYVVSADSGQLTISRVGSDASAKFAYLGGHTFAMVGGQYPLDRYVFQVQNGIAHAYSGYYNGLHGDFRQRIIP